MKKLSILTTVTFISVAASSISFAAGRDYIEVVGSSTVYPFATVVAEVQIGFDGIAIANAKNGKTFDLSLKEIFLALAKEVSGTTPGQLIANPYQTWQDINPALPATDIEVIGPPPTSGTRDAFAELALEGGCKKIDWIKAINKTDKKKYKSICHTVREDGAYIEAGENDNLIVQKLERNPKALGVFGFSFLDQNSDKVKGAKIGGVDITFKSIADGSYPISRPLFFYVKNDHVGKVPGIAEFGAEFTSEAAWGDEGYLSEKGLIPLSQEQRLAFGNAMKNLTPLVLDPE